MGNVTFQPRPKNFITVAQSGADFNLNSSDTPITDAYNYIANASFSNRYNLIVYPGVYRENVIGKNWVMLSSHTISGTIIAPLSGVAYTAPSIFSTVNNINFEMDVTTSGNKIWVSTSGQHLVTNCFFRMTSATPGVTGVLIDSNNTSLLTSTNNLLYQMSGSVAGKNTHEPVKITGTGSSTIEGTEYNVVIGDVDDDVVMWNEGATENHRLFVANFMGVSTNPSYSGVFKGMMNSSVGNNKNFSDASITIQGAGSGTGMGYEVDSGGNSSEVNSSNVKYKVTGFTNNIFANVDSTDELISTSDPLTVDTISIGAGLTTFKNSQASAQLQRVTSSLQSFGIVNEWHAINTMEVGVSKDIELKFGDIEAYGSVADAGGGEVTITFFAPHTFLAGEFITYNSTGNNYQGVAEILSVTSTTINIADTFSITDTGTVKRGSSMKILKRGSYRLDGVLSVIPTGNNINFRITAFNNASIISGSNIPFRLGAGGDTKIQPISVVGDFERDDIIWLALMNTDNETNITINAGTFNISKVS